MPCLNKACSERVGHFDGVNEDELCGICYTSELGAEECSRLTCGHVFHTGCVVQLLKHRWTTLRITFGGFMSCPSCKQQIQLKGVSKPIAAVLGPLLGLKRKVEKQALFKAKEQGILDDARLADPQDYYFEKPQELANTKCAFYECHECKQPYFGGLHDCEQAMNSEEQNVNRPEDLLCQSCLLKNIGAGETECKKHGTEFIDWKCMACCTQARYQCYGKLWFCVQCHDVDQYRVGGWWKLPLKDCQGINCPLGIPHPKPSIDPTSGGCFPLGCGLCRSEKMQLIENRDVRQVITADNLPQAYIYNARKPMKGVVYPEVEVEMPNFIVEADELSQN